MIQNHKCKKAPKLDTDIIQNYLFISNLTIELLQITSKINKKNKIIHI